MRRARRRDLLPVAGMLCLMLLGLAGCGDKGGETGDTTQSTSRLNLQILTADSSAGGSVRQTGAPDAVRRLAPGEPGFITRLDIRIAATDIPTPITRPVPLTTAQQQEVIVELLVPVGSNRHITVSAFNASGAEIFRGETQVDLTQNVVTVTLTLVRVLVPEAANTSALANKAFMFDSGATFGVTGTVTLTFGTFTGNTGAFTLVSGGRTASGNVTIATATTSTSQSRAAASSQSRQTPSNTRCDFAVATSTYPPGQGPQAGNRLPIPPCTTDAVDGRLTLGGSTSAPPTPAPEFPAPNTVSIGIGSPLGPVAPGGPFNVLVTFNTGTTSVISYLFELTFDPAVVQVTGITGIAPFDDLITNQAALSSGVVRFAANNATFTPVSGLLTFANVAFQVVGNAGTSSPLTLRFPPTPGGTGVIVDDVFRPLAGVVFVNGAVQVR